MSTSEWLDEVVRNNVLELFPEFVLADCAVASSGPALTALIGFSGPVLVGALGLIGAEASLAKTAPDDVKFDAHDWVGELANQALGRVKIALLRAGVEIQASTPVVLRGISVSVMRTEQVRTFVLEHADGAIHLWVDYTPRIELQPGDLTPIESDEILDAGEALFF